MICFPNFFVLILSISFVSALATPIEETRDVDLAKRGALLSTLFATDSSVNIFGALRGPPNSLGSYSRASNTYLIIIFEHFGAYLRYSRRFFLENNLWRTWAATSGNSLYHSQTETNLSQANI